ncbi:hypothetical protein [Burkholderia sp. BCC1972]|uniref:hypothetical protein n=1 Tax=Burkholderia sp. BCC1972 TaxID=2817438 RepID=UPI002ABE19AD|nr:hypothetical protein [Burkholderia sp. BCC1972]
MDWIPIPSGCRTDNNPANSVIARLIDTILFAKHLLEQGFYTSPIFFPVIAKDRAGLRIMIRANMRRDDIERFAASLNRLRANHE